jgi:hypothetical protein
LAVGQKLSVAEDKVRKAGFKVSSRSEENFDAPSGYVIRQDPKAGTSAIKDSVVSLIAAEKPTLTGSFTLIDSDVSRTPAGCSGTGGYSDVKAGMQVVVKNEKSEILAVGELGDDDYTGEYGQVACKFPISIKDIPKASFYEIEVGRRGSLKYSFDELRNAKWSVKFSLGGS